MECTLKGFEMVHKFNSVPVSKCTLQHHIHNMDIPGVCIIKHLSLGKSIEQKPCMVYRKRRWTVNDHWIFLFIFFFLMISKLWFELMTVFIYKEEKRMETGHCLTADIKNTISTHDLQEWRLQNWFCEGNINAVEYSTIHLWPVIARYFREAIIFFF